MSNRIVWEIPPPKTRRTAVSARRRALERKPGEWLLWSVRAGSSVATGLRKQGYEVETRPAANSPGKYRIYVRKPATA